MTKISSLFVFLSCLISFFVTSNAAADAPQPAPTRQVSKDYRIVAGDVLDISVWKEEGLTTKALVRPDGGISFPLVGNLSAAGLTVDDVKHELARRLAEYLSEPEVTVSVVAINQKVYVVGKVNKPGEVLMASPITVMQALAMAGGLAPFADGDDIKILRTVGTQTVSLPFDYDSVSSGDDLEQNVLLTNGDVVVVP